MAPLDGSVTELYISPQIETHAGVHRRGVARATPFSGISNCTPTTRTAGRTSSRARSTHGEHLSARTIASSPRDGRTVWVHGEAKVITDEEGRPLFLQGVAFDITERMEAEEKLRANNSDLARRATRPWKPAGPRASSWPT